MPEPLSSKSGFGMKVAVMPWRSATFLTMYLYNIRESAIFTIVLNFMSISAWPPVATSWCWASTTIPAFSISSTISVRTSWSVSVGETGK
jgi:hypothetical protein